MNATKRRRIAVVTGVAGLGKRRVSGDEAAFGFLFTRVIRSSLAF
jgi:hypothetical protein